MLLQVFSLFVEKFQHPSSNNFHIHLLLDFTVTIPVEIKIDCRAMGTVVRRSPNGLSGGKAGLPKNKFAITRLIRRIYSCYPPEWLIHSVTMVYLFNVNCIIISYILKRKCMSCIANACTQSFNIHTSK